MLAEVFSDSRLFYAQTEIGFDYRRFILTDCYSKVPLNVIPAQAGVTEFKLSEVSLRLFPKYFIDGDEEASEGFSSQQHNRPYR